MPYDVPVPEQLRRLWKVKVWDAEVPREEPHVTIIRKTRKWRVSVRTLEFLDAEPPPREVPAEVLDAIRADLPNVTSAWNERHPHNPV